MDAVTRAARRYQRAQTDLEQARADLRAAVLDQLAAGVPQRELAARTGWTRETLRQLARAAAAGPAGGQQQAAVFDHQP